ncbi:MAG: reprolysin-like metallopeptidase, partial [Caldilinea sp.]
MHHFSFLMRTSLALLGACCFFLSCSVHLAQASSEEPGVQPPAGVLWSDVDPAVLPASAARVTTPTRYRALALDVAAMSALLASTPREHTEERLEADSRGILLELPLPDGTFQHFRIVNTPIMAPELAAQYPAIQTYRGVGVDDPTASARLDFTPHGFHAQILSAGPTVYIDPLFPNQTTLYQSFYRHDYTVRPGSETWFCAADTHGDTHGERDDPQSTLPPEKTIRAELAALGTSGTILRTYRLAVAATGEYTQFQARDLTTPTVAQMKAAALAAIVTTMNRVNGIYEREVSIHMTLIANNDALLYTDGASDPYTNNDGFAMLDENQNTLDAVIGNANYDIGHVFSTGGGGVAQLDSPCTAGSKARGVTGSNSPVGDAFDVDYVAHEMGHQFGATHTFNAASGSCDGNRTASTAFEPGSGTTIMAYAGICDPQNVQNNSDPYFHAISLDQILAYTVNDNGNSCAVQAATGNQPPTLTALTPYTIPARTPFFLTGSATDPDGDPLTYQWQQMDLGNATQTAAEAAVDDGSRPLFRVFNPTPGAQRVFPQWRDLLNRTSTLGEALPTTTRALDFRLIARDGQPGGGGVSDRSVRLQVVNTGAAFAVTQPAGSSLWPAGTQIPVSWEVAGTDQAPIQCSSVDILLSTDGGTSFVPLANATSNDGSESVQLPATSSTQARIQIVCSNNVFFALSGPITLTQTANLATFNGTVTAQNGTPLAGAEVTLSPSGGGGLTDGAGRYTLYATAGTYTLTATAAGYQSAVVPNVTGSAGSTVTTDVTMTPLPPVVVTGVVSDALRGFPLYAALSVQPGATKTWSDPATGAYTVTLLQGISYTLQSTPWLAGYFTASVSLRATSASARLDIAHSPAAADESDGGCQAPSFAVGSSYSEGFEGTAGAALPEGWSVNGQTAEGSWRSAGTLNISPQYGDTTVSPHSGTRQVYFNSFDTSAGVTARLWRAFDFRNTAGAVLTFWLYHTAELSDSPDQIQVQVCTATDCSTESSWQNVGSPIGRLDPPTGQWVQHRVSLNNYANQQVRVGLQGISAYGTHLAVDDLAVS